MADDDKDLLDSAEAILSIANNPAAARYALALLFPKLEKILKTYLPTDGNNFNERQRQHRISQMDFARNYFSLDPQLISWSHTEIENILNSDDPKNELRKIRQKLEAFDLDNQSRLRRLFLEALDGGFQKGAFTYDWLEAIVNESPYYLKSRDETARFLFTQDNLMRLERILRTEFITLSAELRSRYFLRALEQAKDITLLCSFFRTTAGDKNRKGGTDRDRNIVFFDEALLRTNIILKIRMLSQENEIWSQALPRIILWFWWGSANSDEVRHFTLNAMETTTGLYALLDVSISYVRSTAGDYEQVAPSWSEIVDLEILEKKANELANSKNSSDQQKARRFLDALEKGKNKNF